MYPKYNYTNVKLQCRKVTTIKGYMKWNIWWNKNPRTVFERTFEVIKIGLYSCRVSHFSLEIFGFVWYVNNSTAYITHIIIIYIIPLNRSNVCWVNASGYIDTHEQFLFDNLNDIPDFPKSNYPVWRMRWSYLHIKHIQISQDWSEIHNSCKVQSL